MRTFFNLKTVFQKLKKPKKKLAIYDFEGMLIKKETSDVRKAIKETAEMINPGDWE